MELLASKYLMLSYHSDNRSEYSVLFGQSALFLILLTYQAYNILHKCFFTFVELFRDLIILWALCLELWQMKKKQHTKLKDHIEWFLILEFWPWSYLQAWL